MNVIGISAHFHNAACCLMQDGRLTRAAEEERFTRVKHDPRLPVRAFRFCLADTGLTIADIDCIAWYEDPQKKLARQIWMGLQGNSDRFVREKLFPEFRKIGRVEREIRDMLGFDGPIEFVDHHTSHAASSYYFSGFEEAAVMTVDGVGEWATTTYSAGRNGQLEKLEEVQFPDSLGLLYSTITSYLGFEVNEGEYKVMGLAPYGEPKYTDQVRKLVESNDAAGFELQMEYFDFLNAERMYSDRLSELFQQPPRAPESEIAPFHQDVARSLQVVLEETLLQKAVWLHQQVPVRNLCMAGGVALNCVANGRIRRDGPFENLFVQPASNDAGGALGAAAVACQRLSGSNPVTEAMQHVRTGPAYSARETARLLESSSAAYTDFRDDTGGLLRETASLLAAGKVIGWFSGRMEFGPRALGGRSILADPRGPDMRDRINALVKKREAFRPFAPAVLAERVSDHFDLDHDSPFMLETCQVRSPLDLPAITHVDGSARVQTVHREYSPRFAGLLEEFFARTGCPILLNTSFNMRGEPIVCSPTDAVRCFIRAQIDALVLDDFLLLKDDIPPVWQQLLGQPQTQERLVSRNVYTLL